MKNNEKQIKTMEKRWKNDGKTMEKRMEKDKRQ